MGRPIGSQNKKTSKASVLFNPYLDKAIKVLDQILERASKDLSKEEDVVLAMKLMPSDSDAIAACKVVLEYGLGRPKQELVVGDEDGEDLFAGFEVSFRRSQPQVHGAVIQASENEANAIV
jgi:hypothetical protein